MMTALRKYIIAGLLVWLPLVITVAIIKFVIDLLDGTVLLLPPEYRPEALLGFSIPGFGILLAVGILILTGMFAANLLGRRLVQVWETALGKIPLVRNIYNSVKQISTTLLASQSKSFRKVVLVEYPRKDCWCIGFLSNEHVETDRRITDQQLQSIYLPTTPNPTSGFNLLIPERDIIELDMSVEDGFKFIISMGVIVPEGEIRQMLPSGAVAASSSDS
ncbi:MAG: DUF502 domain-containing protein [Gammaproteobacteria bacterium]|nr:DUF502 domain-containing protein [Gammaproteobacteria bacterium]MDE0513453.1 DUF502 domain-containing protein [Gammaproteobacteria bacterium]